jgi:hypothetical protein
MQKVDESRRPKTGGRKKGVPNKTTQAAKDAIADAAKGLGGAKRLVAWAKEDPRNERVFWGTIYPKLIPVTLAGDASNPIGMSMRVEFVNP